MNKKILLLIIGSVFCFFASAQTFKLEFMKSLNAKDMKRAEDILKTWDLTDTNDPELYVAFFNFYTVKSMDAGVLSINGLEKKMADKALEFISEGIQRFPIRLDMRIAKIYMLGKLNYYQAYVSEIINLITYSVKIKNNWKEEEFMSVDYPEDMFFGVVADGQEFLFSQNDASLFKEIIRISDEMLKYYPKHNQSRLASSTVYIAQKEFDKSLETLLKAMEIEPKNAIILFNIAYVYNLKGDKTNARKYFESTITHCGEKEDELKEGAKKQLEDL